MNVCATVRTKKLPFPDVAVYIIDEAERSRERGISWRICIDLVLYSYCEQIVSQTNATSMTL